MKKHIRFLDCLIVIAAVATLGLCLVADLPTTVKAQAADIPGGLTAVENSTQYAGVASISSRSLSIGTNLAAPSLWQVTTNAPASSTNALPNSALRYICASGTNIYIGAANLAGTGTNWVLVYGVKF